DLIIRDFARALMQQPNLKLKIGGDGPERINLETLVKELNISHAVTFLGLLSREEVRVRINKASAFILGSDYETFGVVVVEALALGKPVISTKCGGPESIIQPEVGYLVEKNSIDEMAEAIIDLYNNYDNYQAENIRKYCERSFSEQAVVGQLQNLYLSVIHVG
ncbi:glycosyltransferase, partial [Acinetobacter baumannii]|nr:glycosyltransferase [Acinetobacter baumannii]